MVINYGYKREKYEKLVHYICRGDPLFHSPLAQERSNYVCTSLGYTTRRDRKIREALELLFLETEKNYTIKNNNKTITSCSVINPITLKEVN